MLRGRLDTDLSHLSEVMPLLLVAQSEGRTPHDGHCESQPIRSSETRRDGCKYSNYYEREIPVVLVAVGLLVLGWFSCTASKYLVPGISGKMSV